MTCFSIDKKISIRDIKKKDIESIRMWRNQADIKQYFINTDMISKEQQRQWYTDYLKRKDDKMFMIQEHEHFKSIIGTTALYNINTPKKSAEFGRLMIGHIPAQRKGLGTQATILTCKYAFERLNISEIYLYVLSHNIRAIELYKNIGFVPLNIQDNKIYMILNKKLFLV
ncbi:GNAT family N-acetyltransferase [Bacillus cereus group sp. N6]|uniref:GNAT family N-acetyltransferase n=1 Tax=Bacillus cereus group sp. N6 TaxID=2794583 RepID=UPI0018F69C4A|nr:GNAT family N-acetyltransferase [Bacillus cereus group sp. N6]MBJ8113726.1 GNAT family N-acetyltransferase [Bacillus cereus group sp. N6]